jgi:carbamoyltransferase
MKSILGIAAFYHDASATLIVNGKIIAAAQEERFTREKHTADFPVNAIKYCLEEGGLTIDELDAVVFYDKPLLKFERLLQTYYAFAPKGLISFLKSIPIWLNEKLFLKKLIRDGLKEVSSYQKKGLDLYFTEHHLSHAASSFFVSAFAKAAILTIDGVGEWCTASISEGNGNSISIKKELHFPHSVGLLYSAFTYYLGFKVNSGEYKLMGLAPYGNPKSEQTASFIQTIKESLVDIKDDGSIWLNQSYFNYATGLQMAKDKKWESLFSFPKRTAEGQLEQQHCNLAYAIQHVTEEIVLKMAQEAKRITQAENLCLAGGVALNCVANGKLARSGLFKNIYIQPASGDAGGSLGAALALHYMYYGEERQTDSHQDQMQGTYLGPEYSTKEIVLMNRKHKAIATPLEETVLMKTVAQHLKEGKVVGWFQGRMEFGPRALGNRSILGNPSYPEMQKKINLNIKYREGFRPFAPAVLEEDARDYFQLQQASPYMLFVADLAQSHRLPLPEDYNTRALLDKLYTPRSADLQAITHLDFSARVQTVDQDSNPRFRKLLEAFKAKNEHPILVNTSFNVRGEPIVCTPNDAYRCFMSTEMDVLVVNEFMYLKTQQTDWQKREKWQTTYTRD